MRHKYLILLLLPLAACSTPKQQCQANATRDLQVIDLLIVETSQNIERGFAVQQEIVPNVGINYCFGGFGSNIGASFCSGNTTTVRERPIAIDPATERAKLAELQSRRAVMIEESQAALAACAVQFGA